MISEEEKNRMKKVSEYMYGMFLDAYDISIEHTYNISINEYMLIICNSISNLILSLFNKMIKENYENENYDKMMYSCIDYFKEIIDENFIDNKEYTLMEKNKL